MRNQFGVGVGWIWRGSCRLEVSWISGWRRKRVWPVRRAAGVVRSIAGWGGTGSSPRGDRQVAREAETRQAFLRGRRAGLSAGDRPSGRRARFLRPDRGRRIRRTRSVKFVADTLHADAAVRPAVRSRFFKLCPMSSICSRAATHRDRRLGMVLVSRRIAAPFGAGRSMNPSRRLTSAH